MWICNGKLTDIFLWRYGLTLHAEVALFVRKHDVKRFKRTNEEIAAERANTLDILKKMESTGRSGKKLETDPRNLSAKLNPIMKMLCWKIN